MRFAVLDEAVPADIAAILSVDGAAVEPFPDAWRSLADGEILDRAGREGFRWLVTCDKKMPYQQNLTGRTIAVLVLPSQRLPVLEALRGPIRDALSVPVPGHFVLLDEQGSVDHAPLPHFPGKKRPER